jgi:hypothetical protein
VIVGRNSRDFREMLHMPPQRVTRDDAKWPNFTPPSSPALAQIDILQLWSSKGTRKLYENIVQSSNLYSSYT